VFHTAEVRVGISGVRFTEAYRAPFQFSRFARAPLDAGTFALSSSGVTLTDLNGDCFHDLIGRHFCRMLPLSTVLAGSA
jgi:glutamate-1-semialdehyde 2,1-aminomutase